MPNPGSYNEFIADKGLDHGPGALEEYDVALDGFRRELADRHFKGDIDTLHSGPAIPQE